MRRKDREVTDPARIREILRRCRVMRIGFIDGEEVYILPMNFGMAEDGESLSFYFHGATEGRKIDLAKASPRVGFETDCDYVLHEGEQACAYSAGFASVIGTGRLDLVTQEEEKRRGLCAVMDHATGTKGDWAFSYPMDAVSVLRLRVETLSCKVHA